jgi:hypothetical protein
MAAMSIVEAKDAVREVTPEEVAFYRENGWVKLDRLVHPDVVAQMLDWGRRERAGLEAASASDTASQVRDHGIWTEWRFVATDDKREPFRSVALCREMGRNAQLLIGRDVPVRYWYDLVAVKIPAGRAGASDRTGYHQDLPNHPQDRIGTLTIWIALDDVSPEQGSMRFVSGSHREGPLGRGASDQLEEYPSLLDRLAMSPPLHLHPGDATVHDGLTVHGAPANTGTNERWSFILDYFPDDVRYNGSPYKRTDDLALVPGERFVHERFPIIYP